MVNNDQNSEEITMKKTILGIISVLVLIMFLVGCDRTVVPQPKGDYTPKTSIMPDQADATQEMIKFNNINEVKDFLMKRALSSQLNMRGSGRMATFGRMEMVTEAMPMAKGVGAQIMSDSVAQDFSQTNVQYKDVDEADIVKNDNRYIYMIADNKLVIIDAYDADNAEIISETKITSSDDYQAPRAKELFINDDKLVLFVEVNERGYYFERYDIEPRQTYRQKTYAYVYDITDKYDPELSEEFSVTGRYFQSRMIDDIIYIVTQEGVNNGLYINGPVVMKEEMVIEPDIYYFDNPDQNYQFNTITSIDVEFEEVVESNTYMLGYSNTLMVSENNIYIAYQKQNRWMPWYGGREYDQERFYDVVVPRLKGDVKYDIEDIIDTDLSEAEKWEKISRRLAEFYEDVEKDDELQERYEETFEEIAEALEEYDTRKALEKTMTMIHKIAIDDGEMDYVAKGEVFGSLLNQFSLDEYNGNLRLATTVNAWHRRGSVQYNSVYVLDEDMDTIGEIDGIAENEKIYSTRFIGNKLYMVTFKRIDPFFVIDLSDPRNPEVLGELKIPGFSDYLHPYDEDHIIGVGKETGENQWGGVSTKGVKIALFDVSDVSDPRLVDKYEIGDQGTDSPALHDHHAFLFSKTKNLLVLPITEVTEREKLDQYRWSNRVWHGAYVFKVSENGFRKMGTVEHSSGRTDYYNWWNEASVLRSLYMDDNLYTISNKYIKINDLGDDLEELNSIRLPYSQQWRHYSR